MGVRMNRVMCFLRALKLAAQWKELVFLINTMNMRLSILFFPAVKGEKLAQLQFGQCLCRRFHQMEMESAPFDGSDGPEVTCAAVAAQCHALVQGACLQPLWVWTASREAVACSLM